MLELSPETAALYAREQQEKAFQKSLAYQIYEARVAKLDLADMSEHVLKQEAALAVVAVEVFMRTVN